MNTIFRTCLQGVSRVIAYEGRGDRVPFSAWKMRDAADVGAATQKSKHMKSAEPLF